MHDGNLGGLRQYSHSVSDATRKMSDHGIAFLPATIADDATTPTSIL